MKGFADVLVHVVRPFATGERERLQEALRAAPGIRRSQPSARIEQLILVEFDPRAISALGVLRCFRDAGLDARLVGM